MLNFIKRCLRFILVKVRVLFNMYIIKFNDQENLYPNFDFKIFKKSKTSNARVGIISTPHGRIHTPAFIFCATKGIMKSTTADDTLKNKSQIILSNTYHLFLKGHQEIKKMGGLHKALGFNKPMLTDSGGYQVFAMNYSSVSSDIKGNKTQTWNPTLIKINDEGATFRNYYTQEKVLLTPEISIQVQRNLGADLMVVFDECTSSTITYEETKASTERSHLWESRSLDEFKKHNDHTQSLYGIVQGGVYKDLRKTSCDFVNDNPFFGICVGGCLGDNTEIMHDTVNYTLDNLRKDRPVHLLGIGYLKDIFNGVKQGIDTFDCVHPTRVARHGFVFVPKILLETEAEKKTNMINLTKAKFTDNNSTIIPDCGCTTCKNGKGYKISYLNLMLKIKEKSVINLLTNHNIYFFNNLMENIRHGITTDTLSIVQQYYI
jgi:queuine tRNA-ribosyltransferase